MSRILSDTERKAKKEKLNDLITRAEEVVSKAKAESRELTDDEMQEIAEIRDDVRKIKEFLGLDDDARALSDEVPADDAERACGGEQEKRSMDDEMQKRELEDRATFEAFIRGQINERANNMTKDANGAVIPETIANKIVKKVYDISPVLQRSSQYNVKGTLVIPYYDESETAITVGYQNEFEEIASNVGKFTSTITLTGFLAGALALISRSLINNAQFNIVDHVVDLMAEHIARYIEGELLHGTDDKVEGLSGLTNKVTAGATNAITADEVIEVHDAVKDVYQQNAIWIMSTKTRTALRLLKDNMGRYLLQDDISAPFGTTLLGKPVYVSDNMAEIGAGKDVIFYGDMKGLATKFSENISIQVLRERYATQHADGIVGWFEFDAKVEDQQKIAKLTMANA